MLRFRFEDFRRDYLAAHLRLASKDDYHDLVVRIDALAGRIDAILATQRRGGAQ